MPFDNAPIMISTGCGPCDRSSAPLSPEVLAAELGRGDAARKRAQRDRDRGADLVRVEVRVPAQMAPALRFVAAVLAGRLAGTGVSHRRRAVLRLRLLRMLAILGDAIRADARQGGDDDGEF